MIELNPVLPPKSQDSHLFFYILVTAAVLLYFIYIFYNFDQQNITSGLNSVKKNHEMWFRVDSFIQNEGLN